MNSMLQGRIYSYDFLKIVATFGIMCHHYQQRFEIRFPDFIDFYGGRFYWGYLVEFFFIMSGVVIAGKVMKLDGSLWSHICFLGGRYRRLAPMVLLGSMIELAICNSYYDRYGEFLAWKTIFTWYDVFLNVCGFAVGGFYQYFYLCVDSPLWYVNVLIMCYILMCIEHFISGKVEVDARYLFVATMLLGVVIDVSHLSYPFLNGSMSRGYIGFFGGVLLSEYLKKYDLSSKQIRTLFLGIVMVGGLALAGMITGLKLRYILSFFLWPAIIFVFSQPFMKNRFNNRCIKILGSSSFAMYVLHTPFMNTVSYAERYFGYAIEKASLFTMVGYLLCMVMIGILAYYLVEVCFRKSLNCIHAKIVPSE